MAVPENRLPTTADMPFKQMEIMAHTVAKSGMFGMKTPEQALTLMALAQAEGIHPMTAVRDFHIIEGRPSLKADTMLARFQQAGGKVEWTSLTDKKAEARFSHPSGGSVTMDWTIERAQAAKLAERPVWKAYPRAMLRARLISEAIRTLFPSVIAGTYTPEEILDLDPEMPVSITQAINMAERPCMLQSIVDEWLQQIKETATEKDARAVLSGALKEAKEKQDTQRIGEFMLAYDAQLELIREAAAKLKTEAQPEEKA